MDGLPVELDLQELSGAGLFVETVQPLPVDSEVEVFIRIGELRIGASGHVVKSVSCDSASAQGKRPGYALLLTNLDDGDRKRLGAALQALGLPPRPSKRAEAPAPANTNTTSKRTASRPAQAAAAVRGEPSKPPARGTTPSKAPAAARGAPSKPPAPDPQEISLLKQLQAELSELAKKPAWGVLGVSQGAEHDEIRTAFFDASKRYHPHLFARYAHPEIKQVVTELFITHKRAYTTMLRTGKGNRLSRP